MTHIPHIAVVGSGVVGTATGKGFSSLGFRVTFCDIDEKKLHALRDAGFEACQTTDLAGKDIDIVLLTVATPTTNGRMQTDYLLNAVRDVARSVLANATKRVTVAVRSTVLPGTTEDVIIPALEKYSGKRAGKDFGVCMNPEFLRAETPEKDFLHPRGVIIGAIDAASAEALSALYVPLRTTVHVCSPREAEMAKYVSNIFDACKIAFFNEMRVVSDAIGVDADAVYPMVKDICEACWNPGYGLRDMGPFDGMCFPKDTRAFLSWAHDDLGLPMDILSAMMVENEEMSAYYPLRHKLAKMHISIRRFLGTLRHS